MTAQDSPKPLIDIASLVANAPRHREPGHRIPVRVAQSPPEEFEDNLIWLPLDQQTVATFQRPDGSGLPARIVLFQVAGGPPGVAVHFKDDAGDFVRGTVLRWDDGPNTDPRVIHWQAPHCADDQCGSPCGHDQDGGRS